MSVTDVATDLVELCKKGDFRTAMERYYSDDIVSIEAAGEDRESKGIAAVMAKVDWWEKSMDVHSVEVFGPFVFGDEFIVQFKMDVTHTPSGKRSMMDEAGLYIVKGDKIVHERFFYGANL